MNSLQASMPLPMRVATRLAAHPCSILLALLALSFWISVQSGAVAVTVQDWLSLVTSSTERTLRGGAYVLWHLRLPRAAFAMLVGAALGLSGALTQGLFRNPLADPGLLGVSSGAACAAALTIVVLANSRLVVPFEWRLWVLPAAAFLGAIGVCFALDRVARWLTADSIAGLLLTGIALNALAASVIGLCTYLATDEQLRSLSFWTLGSLAAANWWLVATALVVVAASVLQASRLANAMNALALGEATASHIGVDVRHLRTRVIVIVALLCGFAVAWCGMIGFVGLVAPHMVRKAIGPDQRQVAPLSMLVGALLLLAADTVARTVAIPSEIPVGVFTALLGAPFFLLLLTGDRKGG